MTPLQRIVNTLREKEGVDSEGDRTYRVHLTTAEDLVNEAYKVGRSEGNAEIAKLRALLAEIEVACCIIRPEHAAVRARVLAIKALNETKGTT